VTTAAHGWDRRTAAKLRLRRAIAGDAGEEDENKRDLQLPHLLMNLQGCSTSKEGRQPRSRVWRWRRGSVLAVRANRVG
jgi:hypothetical protein